MHNGFSLFAHGSDLVVTVIVINDIQYIQSYGGNSFGESGYANLSVDGGVGITAMVFGAITVVRSMIGQSRSGKESQNKCLQRERKINILCLEIPENADSALIISVSR